MIDDPEAFIRANTVLQVVPHAPEISLYVADEITPIWTMTEEELGESRFYLTENLKVVILLYNEKAVAVDVPKAVNLKVAKSDPGIKGDRVSGATKKPPRTRPYASGAAAPGGSAPFSASALAASRRRRRVIAIMRSLGARVSKE